MSQLIQEHDHKGAKISVLRKIHWEKIIVNHFDPRNTPKCYTYMVGKLLANAFAETSNLNLEVRRKQTESEGTKE